MKKTAVLIATVILSVFCSVSVFAAENETISVLAKSVYTLPDGCYGAKKDDGGNYIAQLPDGVKVTLTPKSTAPNLQLVIVPITEQDEKAYRWISDCTANLGNDLLFYDIYFLDEYGTRVDVDMPIEVSIALMNGYGTLKAAEVSANGRVSQLASKSGDKKIAFTIEKGGYYAIASARTGNTGAMISPQTGENSGMDVWVVLLVAFGVCAAITAICGKKKKSTKIMDMRFFGR